MGRKQKLKSGAEWDLLSGWRHLLCYIMRPGVKKKIKKGLNRRSRHEARADLRKRGGDGE